MEFQFTAHKGFHFARAFAEFLNVPVTNEHVDLPPVLGDGYIREIYLDNGLSLCIHQYKLNQPFILRRLEADVPEMLNMKFDGSRPLFLGDGGHGVEIGTSNLFTELKLPGKQTVNFLVISTTRRDLLDLLHLDTADHPLEMILKENQSFVFYEGLTMDMARTLDQITRIDGSTKLPQLLYHAKVRELIYLLFDKLLTRAVDPAVRIHKADAQKIYEVRTNILLDLSVPPHLPGLARDIGMSESKMKQLFRQIFGDSIYNYYQAARMDAAAQLLKELSVSETGYQLGFTNMSHFTRLFEKHHNIKPKKFKDTLL